MTTNGDRERVLSILREFKAGALGNPGRQKLPIFKGNEVIAFLKPVSKSLENDEAFLDMLAGWRSTNQQAFPTIFRVTREGTEKWLKEQLIGREDRILFLIVSVKDRPVGQMGLSNFDFAVNRAEMVDIIRGVNGILPGIFTLAIGTLQRWAFEELRLRKLCLRVFLDNERAIRLYEHCGFREVRRIPLHKNTMGDITKYEEIPGKSGFSVDRVFLLMEYPNGESHQRSWHT